MKKYILLLLTLGFLFACDHEEIKTYSTVNHIYVKNKINKKNETVNQYVNLKSNFEAKAFVEDSLLRIPIYIMGHLSNVDRPVKAIHLAGFVNDEAIEHQDFEFMPSFIPANSEEGMLNLKLKNSEKLKASGDTIYAYIKLAPNEYFSTDYSEWAANYWKSENTHANNLTYKIAFYANLDVAPRLWAELCKEEPTAPGVYQGIGYYMGAYTARKYEIFLLATGLPPSAFEFTDDELVNETGETVVNFDNARKLFEARFGDLANAMNRWQNLVWYYLNVTEPDTEQIVWTINDKGWKKLN